MAQTRITVPGTVRRGEAFEIRVLIAHPMETGFRFDASGQRVPRSLIRRFSCHYDGELVIEVDLHPAISANPYLAFHALARATGTLSFRWSGDDGFVHTESVGVTVT